MRATSKRRHERDTRVRRLAHVRARPSTRHRLDRSGGAGQAIQARTRTGRVTVVRADGGSGELERRRSNEAREIRTPNLLIWSQTRCRCAIAPRGLLWWRAVLAFDQARRPSPRTDSVATCPSTRHCAHSGKGGNGEIVRGSRRRQQHRPRRVVVQWLACCAHNPKVRGWKPRLATFSARAVSWVDAGLGRQDVRRQCRCAGIAAVFPRRPDHGVPLDPLWHVTTVAILAQGTSWVVAVTQAFLFAHPSLLA